jgi:cell surface protein SprA
MRLDFKSSRNLSLQTDRYDLNEDKTTEYTVGFGYVIQGVKMFGKKKKRRGRGSKEEEDQSKLLKLGRNTGGAQANDLEITFDFSLRDNIRINYKLDEDRDPEPLSGNKTLTISPAVNYQLNQNLRLRFFFDYQNTQPYVSNQFERTTMRGGITVQFQLN